MSKYATGAVVLWLWALLTIQHAAANTTSAVVTSTAPTATTAAPAVGTNLIDVLLNAWADEIEVDYLLAFSRVSGIPVSRIQVLTYGGSVSAVEFGEQYYLSLYVLPPTNRSGDLSDANTAAATIVTAINAAVGVDAFFIYGAVVSARRVLPEARASIAASLSVSYVWVAFLLLGVGMTGVVLGILIRRRSRLTEEKVNAFDEETRRNVPRDTSNKNVVQLMKMVSSAKAAEREALRRERDQLRFAPTARLFVASLQSDHRLQLPPVSKAPDPLSVKPDYQVAQAAQLGSAAALAVKQLHREMDEHLNGNHAAAAEAEAAAKEAETSGTATPGAKTGGGKTLREMHATVRLLDDAEL